MRCTTDPEFLILKPNLRPLGAGADGAHGMRIKVLHYSTSTIGVGMLSSIVTARWPAGVARTKALQRTRTGSDLGSRMGCTDLQGVGTPGSGAGTTGTG